MNIRPKLIISFLSIIVFSIFLTSFLSFQYVERSVIDAELVSMKNVVEKKIIQINTLHNSASSELIFALQNTLFVEYFELPESKTPNIYENDVLQFTEDQQRIKSELEEWIFHFQNKFSVDETCIIDGTGQEHVRLVLSKIAPDEELSSEEKSTPFFEPSFKTNKGDVYVQEPYISPDTNRSVFAYTSPIVLSDGEKPAFFHFEMPFAVFAETIHPSVGQMLILDPSGRIVSDSGSHIILENNESLVSSHTEERNHEFVDFEYVQTSLVSTSPEFQNVIDKIISTNSGIATYFDNEIHYVMYASLPTFDWKLVYIMPYSSLVIGNNTIDNFKFTLIVISAYLLVIGIFAAIIISNKITKPLLTLTQQTEKISYDDYDVHILTRRNDEIGKLSVSFEKMANRIKKIQKEKQEFLAMITHELKTPLQPILGYTHMLKEEELGNLNEKQISAIKKIDSHSNDLLHLIESLLTAQKLDMTKMQFKKEEISLKEFAKSIHHSVLPLMSEKNINLVNLINSDYHITADSARLKEVFLNLIQNSIDFIDTEKGEISFGVFAETQNKVILYVKDNGKGIPEKEQEQIFKKFWQADTSVTRKHGGTGLGLSICRDYIDQMGGNLWVESKPGLETVFYFDLPKSSNSNQ